MVSYGYTAEEAGRTGSTRRVIVPRSGVYTMVARGASGFTGTIHNSSTGLDYEAKPGKGAVVTAQLELSQGDELLICVGQRATSQLTAAGVTDGCGGGSGGGTFIFRKVESLSDTSYMIAIDGEYWECLLVAAGGSGTQDGAYKKSTVKAPDADLTLYSLSNFKAFSTTTASVTASAGVSGVLSLSQIEANGFTGAYYSRNNNYGYGGYGCGSAADDNYSYGGGWCNGTVSYSAASWAKNGGTIAVSEQYCGGSFVMTAIVEDDVNTITKPVLSSVVISPNPVAVGKSYTVSVKVTEEIYVETVDGLFEFAFTNNSLTSNLLTLSEVSYKKQT